MSDMMEYKCPACGGTMEFDSTLQKMKCPYCDTVMTVEEFQEIQKKEQEETFISQYLQEKEHGLELILLYQQV